MTFQLLREVKYAPNKPNKRPYKRQNNILLNLVFQYVDQWQICWKKLESRIVNNLKISLCKKTDLFGIADKVY